jgi:hypothetical protein
MEHRRAILQHRSDERAEGSDEEEGGSPSHLRM